eukprot:TRINITY_DN246_c0_g1_i1.p4 TRINITY_DN246_c0_g1~~TRINITY_DN246_c0_g1_i1.p4  ORF type:complete len:128 (+),score=6.29 TRINITY_DN246_c0_g1_i1:601-984(+)
MKPREDEVVQGTLKVIFVKKKNVEVVSKTQTIKKEVRRCVMLVQKFSKATGVVVESNETMLVCTSEFIIQIGTFVQQTGCGAEITACSSGSVQEHQEAGIIGRQESVHHSRCCLALGSFGIRPDSNL